MANNFPNAASDRADRPDRDPPDRGHSDRSYQFLSFHLAPNLQALLPTTQLGEVISLEASQVVPVFDLPEAVMGICNHRNEVLWIVDLACLLGLPTLSAQNCRQVYNTIVIHQMPSQVGVAVRQVGQLIVCPTAKIQPLPSAMMIDITPRLAFCLSGLYHPPETFLKQYSPDQKSWPTQKSWLVLDGAKIFTLLKAD